MLKEKFLEVTIMKFLKLKIVANGHFNVGMGRQSPGELITVF